MSPFEEQIDRVKIQAIERLKSTLEGFASVFISSEPTPLEIEVGIKPDLPEDTQDIAEIAENTLKELPPGFVTDISISDIITVKIFYNAKGINPIIQIPGREVKARLNMTNDSIEIYNPITGAKCKINAPWKNHYVEYPVIVEAKVSNLIGIPMAEVLDALTEYYFNANITGNFPSILNDQADLHCDQVKSFTSYKLMSTWHINRKINVEYDAITHYWFK